MKSHFKRFILKKAVSATVTSIRKPMIEKFEIPLPPLPIQEEIVRILDKFSLLEAELEAELDCRKRQYEYYRDRLITGDDDAKEVKWVKLGEVCKVYDGTHTTPKYKESGIKFVSVENIKDLYSTTKYISTEDYNKYKIKPQINDVFMTRIGSIGVCNVVDKEEDLAYYVSLALLRPEQSIINSSYLRHVIHSSIGRRELYKRTLVHATPIKINKDEIGKILIPLPPLPTQHRIASILDRFESLTTDISAGLPAEISARRKQYEYYRDKLLTFKRKAI